MKTIFLLTLILGILLSISFTSADVQESDVADSLLYRYPHHPYRCGYNDNCKAGETCHMVGDVCKCDPIVQLNTANQVYLIIKQIGVWQDGSRGGRTYSQYDVTIVNNGNFNIKQINIGTDNTFRLRDNSDTALWNMVRIPNGILALPPIQQSINAHATYTFGFIIEGAYAPNLPILKIVY
ncbi:hypothetical protein ACTA71_005565 [Dictyostelium dimigraforme]